MAHFEASDPLALNERYSRMKAELEEIDAAEGAPVEKQALAVQSLVNLVIGDPAMVGAGFVTRLLLPLVAQQINDITPENSVRDGIKRWPANCLLSQPTSGAAT